MESIDPERLQAWGWAVGAQYEAEGNPSPGAWAEAARAWDSLASLYSYEERDRDIFDNLAILAWHRACGIELAAVA